jgi:hypothetical protein
MHQNSECNRIEASPRHVVWCAAGEAGMAKQKAYRDVTFLIDSPTPSESGSLQSECVSDEDSAGLGPREGHDTNSTPDDTIEVCKRKNRPSKDKRRKTWIKKQIARILGETDTRLAKDICLPSHGSFSENIQTCNSLTFALKALKSNGATPRCTRATALLRMSI